MIRAIALSLRQIVVAWLFSLVFLPVVTVVALLLPHAPKDRFRVWAIRAWGRFMLWLARVDVVVEGAEHIATRAPRIITFNHTSILDIFLVLGHLPDGGMPIVKREVLFYPVMGQATLALGIMPIHRGNSASAQASLKRLAERMNREKWSVVISPEGTRSRDGSLAPFKLGAFHLALDSGAPIVPLIIEGAFALHPRSAWHTEPGRVVLRYLAPVDLGVRRDNLREAAAALRELYARELASPRPDQPTP